MVTGCTRGLSDIWQNEAHPKKKKKSATPVPWWQGDVLECVHALSSSCIVASGLGPGGWLLHPPTFSLKTINQ